jgi:hypothetical protein
MKMSMERAIRLSLVEKVNNNERLSLAEIGMKDVLFGQGRKPNKREGKLPRWLKVRR